MPDFTPKNMMKKIGKELFRDNFHQDIWLKVIERKLQDKKKFVITDCRFPNENKMLIKYNSKLVFIDRNRPFWFDNYKKEIDCEDTNKLHDSENLCIRENFDYIIDNNGTLEKFENEVDILINNHFI